MRRLVPVVCNFVSALTASSSGETTFSAEHGAKISPTVRPAHKVDVKAKQDFYDLARDQGLWREQNYEEGDLQVKFNDAAEIVEDVVANRSAERD